MELVNANNDNLSMLSDLIQQFDKTEYRTELQIISGATLGQHVRHIIEFYTCFLKGLDSGLINYDNRERKLLLEENGSFAQATISAILTELTTVDLHKQVSLQASFSNNLDTIATYPSSASRELAYCLEHTVHHLAIIKIAIKEAFPHVQLEDNLGVAYSTIRYKKENVYTNVSA